jgi:parallel beta-helix repeat protein
MKDRSIIVCFPTFSDWAPARGEVLASPGRERNVCVTKAFPWFTIVHAPCIINGEEFHKCYLFQFHIVREGEREMNKKIVLATVAAVLLSSLVTMCLEVPAEPAPPVHNDTNGKDFATIQTAINDPDTKDNDHISIDAGTFPESVVLNKSLRISGAGELTKIDGRAISAFGISASSVTISINRLVVMAAKTGISLVNCNSCVISSVAVRQCLICGIDLNQCHNCSISKSTVESMIPITSFTFGINVTDCSNIQVSDNKVEDSNGAGISLSGSGISLTGNEMRDNKFNLNVEADFLYDIDTSNTADGKPVNYLVGNSSLSITGPAFGGLDTGFLALINCVNMTVKGLNLTKNGAGILLANTNESRIESNNLQDNIKGIRLVTSSNNVICGNNITSNKLEGIKIESSDSLGNKIYHNIFSQNHPNAYTVSDGNEWDNGYSDGGNNWDDSDKNDTKKGPNQDEPGADGICDHPYNIALNAQDRYPLVYVPGIMWQLPICWNGTCYIVSIIADGRAKNVNFDYFSKQITFDIMGGTWCNITIPRSLLDGALNLSIGDKPIASKLTWSATDISACIEYNLTSVNEIKVSAENVCVFPLTEFPDLQVDGVINILDIFLIAKHFGDRLPNP